MSALLSGDRRRYAIWQRPISAAMAFRLSARSCSTAPKIVSVSLDVADSKPAAVLNAMLWTDIENPEHHFISRMGHHVAGFGIYPARDMGAQFKQFDANGVQPARLASRQIQFSNVCLRFFTFRVALFRFLGQSALPYLIPFSKHSVMTEGQNDNEQTCRQQNMNIAPRAGKRAQAGLCVA